MKTKEEIGKQIDALKAVRDKVVEVSAFGDNHLDAIDAQIRVLDEDMDNDDIYNEWPGDEQNVLTSALDARQWLDGDSEYEDLAAEYPLKKEDE